LELGQVEFRTNTRVFVKSVVEGGLADQLGIRQGYVFVRINGETTERTNAEGVALMISRASSQLTSDVDNNNRNSDDDMKNYLSVTFRNPSAFRDQLTTFNQNNNNKKDNDPITTQIAPAGETTQYTVSDARKTAVTFQDDQRLTVSQLVPPKLCQRHATTDDLLEISYLGTVLDTGTVFDGSAIKINNEAVPGRGNDVTIYFVLGKQPFGQFPPGWDVGLEGMCVGERRRLIIPPVLGYGSTGVPRRGIPPNATLQYDISLISMNGLATPQ
jgi:FK506-binding protein 2